MISMDRETLMMVATVVALLGVVFLFREMNKAKQDVENLKGFSSHLIQRLNAPEPAPQAQANDDAGDDDVSEEKKEE